MDKIKPNYYQNEKGTDLIDQFATSWNRSAFIGFMVGNIIKYVTRFEDKNGLEDLNKANEYLNRLISFESKKEEKYNAQENINLDISDYDFDWEKVTLDDLAELGKDKAEDSEEFERIIKNMSDIVAYYNNKYSASNFFNDFLFAKLDTKSTNDTILDLFFQEMKDNEKPEDYFGLQYLWHRAELKAQFKEETVNAGLDTSKLDSLLEDIKHRNEHIDKELDLADWIAHINDDDENPSYVFW